VGAAEAANEVRHPRNRSRLPPLPQEAGNQSSRLRNREIASVIINAVKPSNARELMAVANVDGALVGGASLKAGDFLGIAAAYA